MFHRGKEDFFRFFVCMYKSTRGDGAPRVCGFLLINICIGLDLVLYLLVRQSKTGYVVDFDYLLVVGLF